MLPALKYFYIQSRLLGKGYGKILWNYVNEVCAQQDISKMDIVCGKNITAFYVKMGAEITGEIESKVNRGVKIDLLQYRLK